ncbi:MAG TPA: CHAD domain-containing protein [Solirubrobacteraceae bacterium]|jgi:CHAD domain-containing protein|nr:CHAD domain-containing protein [Solirubrobacteraceae bacterium]
MPYRLEAGESVEDGIRRCSREQLDHAVQELTDGIKADAVEAIHEARKALKKQRSLLRLARAAFAPAVRRQEATVFRQTARKLSGTRDADVMIGALDELSERYAGTIPQGTVAAARARLVARQEDERDRARRSGAAAAVAVELRAARRRADAWDVRGGGWSALAPGLDRSYRRGRDAFKLARAEPTPENLHEWRKRVKDLWYHLRVLRPLSESTMNGQADEAHRLSELLGDDHDLWVLREALSAIEDEITADLEPVLGAIDHRTSRLETAAVLLGERLYAEKPKAFLRRIHRYWKAWRKETKSAASMAGA